MSKREKILICISTVILIALLVTSVSFHNLKITSQFSQNQLDIRFVDCLSIAVSAYREVDEAGFANEQTEETFYKNAYACDTMLSLTSYDDNEGFQSIVILLKLTVLQQKVPILSEDLISRILRYAAHPDTYADWEPEISEEIQNIRNNQFENS